MAEKLAPMQGSKADKLPVECQPGTRILGKFVVNILELAE